MKDRSERRMYRRSPGRQYGYDYNPLRTQTSSGSSQSGQLDTSPLDEQWPNNEEKPRRTTGLLAPRPDPRRTRQLIRQSILASKARSAVLDQPEPQEVQTEDDLAGNQDVYDERADRSYFTNRNMPRFRKMPAPVQQDLPDTDEDGLEEGWIDNERYIDPDIGEEDPLERRVERARIPQARAMTPRASSRRPSGGIAPARSQRGEPIQPIYEEEYDDYEDYDEYEPQVERRKKKKGLSRRRFLFGLGVAAVGGTAVAAYELAPKVPQALESGVANVEHEIQDAFNRGFNAGAEAVRKEFITALNNLEGVSLDVAIGAARLTRVAYDVFVSPLVTFSSTVVGDFLSVALKTVTSARGWLKYYGQDNATLASFQAVLQSWVDNASKMPRQVQSITDSDLDGAQTYLRNLQRKIKEEQAKLNQPKATPTPKPSGTPKH